MWWKGRHRGLKILWLQPCRFESCHPHHGSVAQKQSSANIQVQGNGASPFRSIIQIPFLLHRCHAVPFVAGGQMTNSVILTAGKRRTMKKNYTQRLGPFRQEYERNKKKILMFQDTCALCGKPVDKRLKYPHPMSATIDHIIPIDRGGHPSDICNLQLAHMCCNRAKSNKLQANQEEGVKAPPSNRVLPWSLDWTKYKADSKV